MAVWKAWLLKADMIKKDAIIIDVWFSIINWKIYWDCDTIKIDKLWTKITPVPGWVWAMTVAMLMKNTLKAFLNNN
jgi:methylenetetrahydrofolate dehydrogenase (NADP+)/methenyltetrahydrofolate cyclohydrolase